MSMGWNGLEREKLDYILTDVLPVEVSELFSFSQFYKFLLRKDNQKILKEIIKDCKTNKAQNNKLFKHGWATIPLRYMILKNSDSFRKMSIIQPFSALNLYFFIECYQDDIIHYFEKKHTFSLRYHKKETNLYYKTRKNKIYYYFQKESNRIGRRIIQQAGNYFKITKFNSLNAFADSRAWRKCNFKYNFYAKLDYQSCFDSIYTHSFSWIVERNTIDAKKAENSNLFITIDRILQNINGRFSNGIVVGPEFSRMIAEILLQHIDNEVLNALENENIIYDIDYTAFRYVDDIFIFANHQTIIKTILEKYKLCSGKFLLQLNDLKLEQGTTPYLPKEWLEKTRRLSDIISEIFYKEKDNTYLTLPLEDKHIVKKDYIHINRIKDEVTVIVKNFPEYKRVVVSFLLSTILNNISKKRKGITLFRSEKQTLAFTILEIAFFIYAFFPGFELTRKLISIISYIDKEINIKGNKKYIKKMHEKLNYYSFIFTSGNLFDLCDWLPFLSEYNLRLSPVTEQILIKHAIESNNPIILANILVYSQYSKKFSQEINQLIEEIVLQKIKNILNSDEMMREEFWYILVFHNCPYMSIECRKHMNAIISNINTKLKNKIESKNLPSDKACSLICNFLNEIDSRGNKPENSFFNWNGVSHFAAQITYRTYQRTLFKKYHKKNSLFTSLS